MYVDFFPLAVVRVAYGVGMNKAKWLQRTMGTRKILMNIISILLYSSVSYINGILEYKII